MAMASNKGMDITAKGDFQHAALFGEDQARYLCTLPSDAADIFEIAAKGNGAKVTKLGTVGGDTLKINESIAISVETLRQTYESWFPDYMNGEIAQAAE